MGKEINALPSENGLNVIWFEDGRSKAVSTTTLLATDLNKRKAYGAILETSAVGTHDGNALFSAIRMAYTMNADAVWLISKGLSDRKESDAVLTAIQKSSFKNMRINTTVKYTGRYDKVESGFLYQVCEHSGGLFIVYN